MKLKRVTPTLARVFTCAFLVSVGSFLAMVATGVAAPRHDGISSLEAVLMFLIVASGIVWYVTLGMIAARLGRSWLVWTGLSFITAPLGPLVAYPMMLSRMRSAATLQSAPTGLQ